MMIVTTWVICCYLLISVAFVSVISAHPLYLDLDGGETICIKYRTPDQEEGRTTNVQLAYVAVTGNEDPLVEEFYSDYFEKYKAFENNPIPSDINESFEIPPNLQNKIVTETENTRSGSRSVTVRITDTTRRDREKDSIKNEDSAKRRAEKRRQRDRRRNNSRHDLSFHSPLLIEDAPLDGEFCLKNKGRDVSLKVLYLVVPNIVLDSDEDKEDNERDLYFVKKENIDPLEKNFLDAKKTVDRVLTKMKVLERKQNRMKKTNDGTHVRLKYFSYLSIFLLLVVSGFQVMYLKSFFRKKKLI